jgi:hypothetical protein
MIKMNRKLILLYFLIILLSHLSFGQESQKQKKHDFWQRVSVGGNLGLQFGSITAIDVSPEAVIRVVDQLHLGVGFSYSYLQISSTWILKQMCGEDVFLHGTISEVS